MARQAKVVISSVNQVGPGLKAAAKDLVSFESNVVRLGNSIKSALTVGAITAVAAKVAQFGFESVRAFGQVERSMIQLKTALGGNEQSFDRMNGLIDTLAKKSLGTKNEIQDLVADLAALGKSDTQIENIANAAVNLANVTGQSLDAAMKQINATFDGTTGKLGKLLPELNDLTAEQLRAGDAADLINQKFGALSDEMAGGVSQKIKNLSDSFGDLRENIGERMLTAFSPMLTFIQQVVDGWNDAYTAQKKYQDALNANDPEMAAALKRVADLKKEIAKLEQMIASGAAELQGLGASDLEALNRAYAGALRALKELENKRSGTSGYTPAPTAPSGSGTSAAPTTSTSSSPGTSAPPVEQINAIADAWARMGNYIDYALEGAVNVANVATPFQQAWGNALESMAEKFTSWSDLMYNTISDVMNAVGGVLRDALMAIGEMLVNGQMDWKNLKVAALQAISQILQALAAQLFALAAIKLLTFQFGQAALAAAAGAAALVAAGAVGAWAANLSSDGGGGRQSPTDSPSSSPGAAAQYTGSQPITFNFYNQGNVVGSGGLEELAMLIDSIIKRNARYA